MDGQNHERRAKPVLRLIMCWCRRIKTSLYRTVNRMTAPLPQSCRQPDYGFIINPKQASRVQVIWWSQTAVPPLIHWPIMKWISRLDFPTDDYHRLPSDAKLLGRFCALYCHWCPTKTWRKAVAYVNEAWPPLALYVFGEDKTDTTTCSRIRWVAARVLTKRFFIAQQICRLAVSGHQGMGRYHGKYSFDTFSHPKAVFF